jgi:hypothetical protein
MNATVKEQVDLLMAEHDDDPPGSLERLKSLPLEDIEISEVRRLSWLVNHLAGEQLKRWHEAHALQQRLRRVDTPAQALLARSAAAMLAGALLDGWQAERELVTATGCTEQGARCMVRLAVLQFIAASAEPLRCAEEFNHVLIDLAALGATDRLEKITAPILNNLVTAMIDRADAPFDDVSYQQAVMQGAAAARSAWQLAGTWVNHERAEYLCALTANAVRDWSTGAAAAQHGLDLIAANGGEEEVDQAFLSLELSRAQTGLHAHADAAKSLERANAIAAGFKSQFLIDWYADRVRIAQASHESRAEAD